MRPNVVRMIGRLRFLQTTLISSDDDRRCQSGQTRFPLRPERYAVARQRPAAHLLRTLMGSGSESTRTLGSESARYQVCKSCDFVRERSAECASGRRAVVPSCTACSKTINQVENLMNRIAIVCLCSLHFVTACASTNMLPKTQGC